MAKPQGTSQFRGFSRPNYTIVPDELFDELLTELSGAELKALLYIVRRTFGFKKDADSISLSQMLHGIVTQDGRTLDRGAGLSKPTLLQALRSLQQKNVIVTERRRSAERGDEPTIYWLRLAEPDRRKTGTPPVVKKLYQGGGKRRSPGPWSKNLSTQQTALQETGLQHTVLTSNAADMRPPDSNRTFRHRIAQGIGYSAVSSLSTPVPTGEEAPGLSSLHDLIAGRQAPAAAPEPRQNGARSPEKRGMIRTTVHRTDGLRIGPQGQNGHSTEQPQRPRRGRRPNAPLIEAVISEFSQLDLNDADHTRSNITRTVRLWQRSGLSEEVFVQSVIYPARSITRQQGTIRTKATNGIGVRNPAPYFFAVVEDILGIRESKSPS